MCHRKFSRNILTENEQEFEKQLEIFNYEKDYLITANEEENENILTGQIT